ncbi:urease accessory protein UreD [Asanoa ishikariensis]|uniref:Urease accessory protein UreD n=1 Tax=Asanoa ishikariensis TaxID=137265 RepID=A0A1H3SB09_9ACTN|nr:urease accessory protein UreD [Asanoa ishikariensis]GIF70212.1 urease accessory protein UreD [Asanoa ishikariensis]SDZ35216.1 urease accessory protein [Asanoa ishikariensis]
MRAEARLVAEADGRGGTRLSTVYGEPPLLPRRTGHHQNPTAAEVHLVGGAAGPLGGDDLRIDITVAPGAHLVVRTIAASLAQPSHPPAPSTLTITAKVGTGATLDWLPEPTVAVAGCDHLSRSIVDLADGATLRWREELVAGRHAEPPGDLRLETTVRYAGRTILRHDLAIGPRAKGWHAMLGRAAGTLLLVGPEAATAEPKIINRMPLANGPAALISATGPDARTVRTALDEGAANTRAHDPDAKPGNWRKG